MENNEINKLVAKTIHGKNLVFDDKTGLMATSLIKLQESLDSGWIGTDGGSLFEPISFCNEIPNYSTNIKDAWRLAENFGEYFNIFYTENTSTELWNITCEKHPHMIHADTITKAICKMFLAINGVLMDDIQ